jgi:hypothetical protein
LGSTSEVRARTPSEYLVRLTFSQRGLQGALVEDVVPAEWEVEVVSAGATTATADESRAATTSISADESDFVTFQPIGPRGPKGYRATQISWFPERNDSVLIYKISLRKHSAREYLPNKSGCLPLPAAVALDTSTRSPLLDERGRPLVSNALALAAICDANRDRTIDYTGEGDEDGDGLGDYEEACVLGTDPCRPDTDRDRIPDGEDSDPLDRRVQ